MSSFLNDSDDKGRILLLAENDPEGLYLNKNHDNSIKTDIMVNLFDLTTPSNINLSKKANIISENGIIEYLYIKLTEEASNDRASLCETFRLETHTFPSSIFYQTPFHKDKDVRNVDMGMVFFIGPERHTVSGEPSQILRPLFEYEGVVGISLTFKAVMDVKKGTITGGGVVHSLMKKGPGLYTRCLPDDIWDTKMDYFKTLIWTIESYTPKLQFAKNID